MGRRDDLDASLLPYAGSRIKYARSFHYHSWRGPHHSIPTEFLRACGIHVAGTLADLGD
jgi:hypothetical protein